MSKCDSSAALSRGEEHDVRDTIRVYKKHVRKDSMEFGDHYVHAPAHKVLKIAKRVGANNASDMDKVVILKSL